MTTWKNWWVYSIDADTIIHSQKRLSQNAARKAATQLGEKPPYGPIRMMRRKRRTLHQFLRTFGVKEDT